MRRCRTCKQYAIANELPKSVWWCSPACKVYRNGVRVANVKAKPKKKKLKSIARVVDDCAVLLQRLVRLKAADSNGYAKCVTCGKVEKWQDLEGGHFIQRNRTSVKIEEENLAPQCHYCNHRAMKTTLGVLAYREYMVGMYGQEFVDELIARSKQSRKYYRADLELIRADFVTRIKEQESRLGI